MRLMRLMFAGWLLLAVPANCLSITRADDVAKAGEPSPLDAGVVNPLTLNQWVCPNEAGVLVGRVVLPSTNGDSQAVANAKIALLNRDGKAIHGQTDELGEFRIENVAAGVYSMTAKADNIFACCAMHVLDVEKVDGANFPSTLELAAASVDFTMVKSAIIRYVPPTVDQPAAALPSAQFTQLAEQVVSNEYFRVERVDGGMKGVILLAGTQNNELAAAKLINVFIVKNGEAVARTVTDEEGNFRVDNLPAGDYSLLAVGSDGVGLAGFELADVTGTAPGEQPSEVQTPKQLVGLFGRKQRIGHCKSFQMQVAPCPEVIQCVEEVIIEEVPMVADNGGEVMMDGCGCGTDGMVDPFAGGFGDPLGGGSYGGGGGSFGGGGGGFGGGGGGFGAIAGLAGIGAIIAVAVDNDDDYRPIIVPPPASPSSP